VAHRVFFARHGIAKTVSVAQIAVARLRGGFWGIFADMTDFLPKLGRGRKSLIVLLFKNGANFGVSIGYVTDISLCTRLLPACLVVWVLFAQKWCSAGAVCFDLGIFGARFFGIIR
jgi:hypothetical protein